MIQETPRDRLQRDWYANAGWLGNRVEPSRFCRFSGESLTDIDLLNKSREHLETAIDILWKELPHNGHKLPYSAKKARKSYLSLTKSKRWTKVKCRKAISEQLRYIELATVQLTHFRLDLHMTPASPPRPVLCWFLML